jgi:hypothetical protein
MSLRSFLIGPVALLTLTMAAMPGCGGGDDGTGGSSAGGNGTGASGATGGTGGTGGSGGTGTGTGGAGGGTGGTGGEGGNCPPPDNTGTPPTPVVNFVANVTVSTLAGSGTPGTTDGNGATAQFNNPVNVLIDGDGDILVADFESGTIRSVTPAGEVTTPFGGQSSFSRPFGLALSDGGELWAQTDYNTSGTNGPDDGSVWTVDLSVGAATIRAEDIGRPRGLVFSSSTTLMLSHPGHHAVQALNTDNDAISDFAGEWDCPGFDDGTGTAARFYFPYDVDQAPNGDFIVIDSGNHAIRRITGAGVVTTIAGTGKPGMVDGSLSEAMFNAPRGVAVDDAGLIYVSDLGNHRIRRIDVDNDTVETLAGDGTAGFADGAGDAAQFFGQEGIDVTGDGSTLYVADGTEGNAGQPYHRIRTISIP